MTHTFAILGISKAAYEEIRELLKSAGYEHAIMQQVGREVIDMHGIAISIQSPELEQNPEAVEIKKE